jgi:NTP pyrophosphatase (non-canonical NTP hydrolase)
MTAESVVAEGRRESILSKITDIDDWLDSGVSDRYQREPLAQDWARVAKVNEEAGEAIEAMIAWTGQNPRKPQRDEARGELLDELADVALTAILGMQHFVKDADATMWIVWKRLFRLHDRMREALARLGGEQG